MIRPIDLFGTASSGIMASSRLIQTTGNNIANVNTEGFVRERTTFEGGLFGTAGRGSTERLIDIFAQNQLRRDTTQVSELDMFVTQAERLDNLFAGEASSVAGGLNRFFAAFQTANDDPTNLASRQQVLFEADALRMQMGSMSAFMQNTEAELNQQFDSEILRANGLIQSIGELNKAIITARGGLKNDEPSTLLNQRDQAVLELAEIMGINVREAPLGSLLVNLNSGESLVLEDGSFNLIALSSSADLSTPNLQLRSQSAPNIAATEINVTTDGLGGRLGGLFRFRDEMLSPSQRDLGQIALALADAVNSQNRLGMNMDSALGGDIFSLPEVNGLPFPGTTGNQLTSARLSPGAGALLPDADFKVTVTAVTAGQPTQVSVELLNANGSPKLDSTGTPIVFSPLAVTGGEVLISDSLNVSFDAGSFSVGNEFLYQPTKLAAQNLTMATTRPEDVALASPVRASAVSSNQGDGQVSSIIVSNTETSSAFTGTGSLDAPGAGPGGVLGAPTQIIFLSATNFEVRDSGGNLISTVTGAADFNNLIAQAKSSGTWPAAFTAAGDYPGYDLSLNGQPQAGDRFTITYNTNGIRDNSNGLRLANLQDEPLVQFGTALGSGPGASTRNGSFNESYSFIVSAIGQSTASADIALQAAEAMKDQSTAWFESQSGVNLDEEASNLIRFQQSYSAAARILSTAQELFNTLLAAVR